MNRWYYKLVKNESGYSLYDNFNEAALRDKFIVSVEDIWKGENVRKYKVLSSAKYIVNLIESTDSNKRNYHEIVPGSNHQKPRFDIDIKRGEYDGDIFELADRIKDDIIDSVKILLERDDYPFDIASNIAIYSSHGSEKASYHIVIDKYCCVNHEEALGFYEEIMKLLPEEYSRYIDPGVYGSTQSFRLLYCSKYGSNRKKRFRRRFVHREQEYNFVYIKQPRHDQVILFDMMVSLLSYTSYCVCLPNYYIPKDYIVRDIVESKVEEAFSSLSGLYPEYEELFDIKKVANNKIYLKNKEGYICHKCNRVHDNENPVLIVNDGDVIFYCRRNKEGYTFLNNIGLTDARTYRISDMIFKAYIGSSNERDSTISEESSEEWNPIKINIPSIAHRNDQNKESIRVIPRKTIRKKREIEDVYHSNRVINNDSNKFKIDMNAIGEISKNKRINKKRVKLDQIDYMNFKEDKGMKDDECYEDIFTYV